MRSVKVKREPETASQRAHPMGGGAMLGAISGRSPMPLYLRTAESLRKQLELGRWRVGERLPSIERLARDLKIARMTLRQALKQLEADGIVRCEHGRGTYVSRDVSPQRRYRVATDWTTLIEGIASGVQKTLPAGAHRSIPRLDSADCRLAESYRYIKRLNLKDGIPYGFMSYHIATNVFEMSSEAFLRGPVLPALAELAGLRVQRAWQAMSVTTADAVAADLLGIPLGAPVVLARRFVVDAEGVAIFVSDITYRGDFVRFEVDLLRGSPFESAPRNARRPTQRCSARKGR